MTILRERKAWKSEKPSRSSSRMDALTSEQAAYVREAMRVLRIRLGGAAQLAKALHAQAKTVKNLCSPKGRAPSAGAALKVATLAGVSVEDVLAGKWPVPGSCPLCGRCGE